MYVVFADLGKDKDFAAQGIIQHVVEGSDPRYVVDRFVLRYVTRLSLKTSYSDQVKHFKMLSSLPDMHGDVIGCFDATGIGKPVAEEFKRQNIFPKGITITSGQNVGANDEGLTVPKVDLVDRLLIESENMRFIVPPDIDEQTKSILKKELIDFKRKVNKSTKNVSYGAGHDSIHDDVVLGICLGLWWLYRNVSLVENIIEQKKPEPYNELSYGM